jgi:hypothetical protein
MKRTTRVNLTKVRNQLLRAARARSTVTYGRLMRRHRLSRGRPLTAVIGIVDRLEAANGAPGFAAIIVRKDTGFPGGGYFCDDDLPAHLRNPRAKCTDPRLTPAQKKHIIERQNEIWDFYGKMAP